MKQKSKIKKNKQNSEDLNMLESLATLSNKEYVKYICNTFIDAKSIDKSITEFKPLIENRDSLAIIKANAKLQINNYESISSKAFSPLSLTGISSGLSGIVGWSLKEIVANINKFNITLGTFTVLLTASLILLTIYAIKVMIFTDVRQAMLQAKHLLILIDEITEKEQADKGI